MTSVFFDCQVFTTTSAHCPCDDWPFYERVTELEASFVAVRTGRRGAVLSRVLEVLGNVYEGLGRRCAR